MGENNQYKIHNKGGFAMLSWNTTTITVEGSYTSTQAGVKAGELSMEVLAEAFGTVVVKDYTMAYDNTTGDMVQLSDDLMAYHQDNTNFIRLYENNTCPLVGIDWYHEFPDIGIHSSVEYENQQELVVVFDQLVGCSDKLILFKGEDPHGLHLPTPFMMWDRRAVYGGLSNDESIILKPFVDVKTRKQLNGIVRLPETGLEPYCNLQDFKMVGVEYPEFKMTSATPLWVAIGDKMYYNINGVLIPLDEGV